jgi:gliding motility-associated transport system permease protein
MANIWAIFKKELRSYFVSPVAYGVLAIFAGMAGFFFWVITSVYQTASLQSMMNPMMGQGLTPSEWVFRPLFRNLAVIMLFMMPALTARLFAEEKKQGTAELLFTYPIRDIELLLGKFLAAVALFLCMLGMTLVYPLLLAPFVRIEWVTLLAGYLGLVLLGVAFLALGALVSTLTEHQLVAFAITFGAALLLWIVAWPADQAGASMRTVMNHLSIIAHQEGFSKGVIESKDVIFYLNFTLLFLFLTLRSLESKRWRG